MLKVVDLINDFREKGRRVTPQRLAIFKALEGNIAHPTAEDLYRLLVARHPTLTLATVYQTLKILKEDGALMELHLAGDRRHYDPETTPHSHAVCTSCGTVEDVMDETVLPVPEGNGNFEFTGYRISYYGRCADCRGSGNHQNRK
ncbi:MAG: transcriptional repressor [Deltaproteobacteria bacterium]|nr:transcriptional repressor [Deltaproteobacteria bacterium]